MISIEINVRDALAEIENEALVYEVISRELIDKDSPFSVKPKKAHALDTFTHHENKENIINELTVLDMAEVLNDGSGYTVVADDELVKDDLDNLRGDELYRRLCDLVGCSYYTSKDELLIELKNLL